MLHQLKELFGLLTSSQRKRFYKIQILVVFMAFSEVVGITSIGPFMALVGNIKLIESNKFFALAYAFSGLKDPYDFLFALGIIVLVLLTFASVISMIATWRLSLFAFKVGTETADRLYSYYMKQNWLFHTRGSSAHLVKQVSTESVRITSQVILPLMHMNARIVLASFIAIALLIFNPVFALVGVILFLSAYVVLFRFVRRSLKKNGTNISDMSMRRFRLMNEGFGGIKDILLLGRSNYFIDHFRQSGEVLARASGVNNALTYAPRYLMELLAFGVMISLVLFLIRFNQGDLGAVLPILAIYGLAGFKMLPALQNIYAALSEIKGNIAAFESIKNDLIESRGSDELTINNNSSKKIQTKKKIELKNIDFKYPDKIELALKNLSLVIPANKFIGFVGPSGAGKSTVIDLLLGLIAPISGSLIVDDVVIESSNVREWQNSIGFVPQSIFLSEGTIVENIAFGVSEENINYQRIEEVVKLSRLQEFLVQLPLGLNTKVGERGVQLSGGQRQRIGIARALYEDADILIFDEATSALDGITEKLIMDAINEFSGKKTIIMIAHRLKTVANCDIIYYLENGELKSTGSYNELLQTNSSFKKMTEHA